MQVTKLSLAFLTFGFGCIALAQTPTPAAVKPPATAPAKPAPPKREPGLYCSLTITHGVAPVGTITFKFFDKESPITVKNFRDLALGLKEYVNPQTHLNSKAPLFTGLTFHRVVPDFMIQGGDPTGTGMGGTAAIPDEFHPSLKFDVPGRVAMANAGPGTGSCQFFITEVATGHLNGRHTIFGQVVEGQELVGKIARLPTGSANKPLTAVKMSRVRIFTEPQAVPAVKKAVTAVKPVVGAPKPAAPKPAVAKPAVVKPAAPPAQK